MSVACATAAGALWVLRISFPRCAASADDAPVSNVRNTAQEIRSTGDQEATLLREFVDGFMGPPWMRQLRSADRRLRGDPSRRRGRLRSAGTDGRGTPRA